MTLLEFRDMLLTISSNVHHRRAAKQSGTYVVWDDYDCDGYSADNRRLVKVQQIQVSLFTKKEYDPLVKTLEKLFEDNGVSYGGPYSATDDDDESYTHHAFNCEVILDGT